MLNKNGILQLKLRERYSTSPFKLYVVLCTHCERDDDAFWRVNCDYVGFTKEEKRRIYKLQCFIDNKIQVVVVNSKYMNVISKYKDCDEL